MVALGPTYLTKEPVMPRRRNSAECERIIRNLYKGIRRGEYPPGTPIPGHEELRTQYGTDPSCARAAVECLFRQGVVTFPLEGGGSYFVTMVPTRSSRFRRWARPTSTFQYLVHLYRPAHQEWGVERIAQAHSLCGMSSAPADGSGRTTNPAASTCPACSKVYANGGNILGPHGL
ncbi:GntR family transcriptional regulator [Streptomyces sp. NPDC055140]